MLDFKLVYIVFMNYVETVELFNDNFLMQMHFNNIKDISLTVSGEGEFNIEGKN